MGSTKICPWCWLVIKEGAGSCLSCHKKLTVLPDGTLMAEGMVLCVRCGKPNKPDVGLCFHCHQRSDGSDITLGKTPVGQKADRLLRKIYLVLIALMIPSIWVGFGWFLGVSFLTVAVSFHVGTLRGSKSLKEASDSTFMISLVFVLIGGYLTVAMGRLVMAARANGVGGSTQEQLLIFAACVLLTGVAGAFWAARQGIPNVWKFIKDLYTK